MITEQNKHLFVKLLGEYPFLVYVRPELLKTLELRSQVLTELINYINWRTWCGLNGGMNRLTWKDRIDMYAFKNLEDSSLFRKRWGIHCDDPCDKWNLTGENR